MSLFKDINQDLEQIGKELNLKGNPSWYMFATIISRGKTLYLTFVPSVNCCAKHGFFTILLTSVDDNQAEMGKTWIELSSDKL